MTYEQYQSLVRKNSLSAEPDFNSLHIYLQNLCGRILHFRDIPALADIVFIDPMWLHQTIYKVLNQDVLDNKGEFTLAEAVIDSNILDTDKFLKVMKEFHLVFEIPNQSTPCFVAPQYLPVECPLSPQQLKKQQQQSHHLALTLKFEYYLPPSLISRIISLKGHLIKAQGEPLWRNGLIYTEYGLSTFLLCTPEERKIEIYIAEAKRPTDKHRQILREFMVFMEKNFSDEIESVFLSLPKTSGIAKWKDLYRAKKRKIEAAENYDEAFEDDFVDSKPFGFLFEEFERKPINVFICYAHDDHAEMLRFVEPLKKEFTSFHSQQNINISPFTDQELRPGMLWDEVLKAKIKENDILICLLSPSFFGSDYIEQNEYGQIMRKIADGQRESLIAPVYLKPCYVSTGNPIGSLQFFKPLASQFNLSDSIVNFSFENVPDNYVGNYVNAFVEIIAGNIEKIWKKK